MHHPIIAKTRLVNPMARLYRRLFQPDDPHGWADYHCVEDADGTLWIHTHGLRRWQLPDMEFVGVPAAMRGHAYQLLFEIVAHARLARPTHSDMDLEGMFSAPGQSFRQAITLCPSDYRDPAHRNMMRIVDRGLPMESGFPRRLFASHIASWAEFAADPLKKEGMCRQALGIYPGCYLEMNAGIGIDPQNADLTDLQHRGNLAVYLSLANALFEQDRAAEGERYLEEAIARCPGWAQTYRNYLIGKYKRKDAFMNFWREADLERICTLYRPANTTGPMPAPKAKRAASKKRRPKGGKKVA